MYVIHAIDSRQLHFFSLSMRARVRALSVSSLCLGCGPIEKHCLCSGCVSCVCGHLFVFRAAKSALFLCSGCVSCVYEYPLCAQLRVKVHPHCAQTACRACMGARSVLRLWAKSAPALCSDFFFRFFPAGRMQHPPSGRETKKSAA